MKVVTNNLFCSAAIGLMLGGAHYVATWWMWATEAAGLNLPSYLDPAVRILALPLAELPLRSTGLYFLSAGWGTAIGLIAFSLTSLASRKRSGTAFKHH